MRPLAALLTLLLACAPPIPAPPDAGAADAGLDDGGPPPPPPLRINELMARNASVLLDEADGQPDDWVELRNDGAVSVSLAGVRLSDDLDAEGLTLPALTLAPGAHLVLFADGQPEQGPAHAPFRLAGGGESLFLIAADGRLIDEVEYGELAVDQSAGRARDAGAFAPLAVPTPGADNGLAAARPELPAATGVVINELLAENTGGLLDEAGEAEDWVELLNTSAVEQDLSRHHLSDSAGAPFLYTLPEGTRLAPGAFLIVFLDGEPSQGALHAGFGLDVGGDRVALHAPGGDELDAVDFGPQIPDLSLARQSEGGFAPATPTPGAPND